MASSTTASLDVASLTNTLNPIKGTPVSYLNILAALGLGLAFLLVRQICQKQVRRFKACKKLT